VGALLVTVPALADESPAANPSVAPAAAAQAPAVMGESTPSKTSAQTDGPAVRKSRRASANDAANKTEALQIKQVPLKGPTDRTVCRREEPTGSRISVKRCSSTSDAATSTVQNEIMRRDIEEMRDRQIYEQLQRASVGMTPPIQGSPSR
jgi:hypothetical protein